MPAATNEDQVAAAGMGSSPAMDHGYWTHHGQGRLVCQQRLFVRTDYQGDIALSISASSLRREFRLTDHRCVAAYSAALLTQKCRSTVSKMSVAWGA